MLVDKHADYIKSYTKIWQENDKIEFVATEHFWLSGIYWGLTALHLLGRLHEIDQEAVIAWTLSCKHRDGSGGFGSSPRNDAHLLYTLSAVQVLALFDKLDLLDADEIAAYVAKLQQPDGSFSGDEWGEVDTRFSYCALLCLSILGKMDAIDVPKAVEFVLSCRNFDGGFGCRPGSESHAGQVGYQSVYYSSIS